MTYAEFKDRVLAEIWHDTALNDTLLKAALKGAAADLLNSYDILDHIESDRKSAQVFRDIDATYFVRPFNMPVNDGDIIDFENESVLSALVASVVARKNYDERIYFKTRSKSHMMDYMLNTFDESSPNVCSALMRFGYARPYIVTYELDEPHYKWDERFIANLQNYLGNVSQIRNLSYEKFIKLFIEYQDGGNSRHDMMSLDHLLSLKAMNLEGANV